MTVAEPIVLTAETDAGLLAAVARGDSNALGQLANRYGGFIHAAAFRQTGDPATADDVTQAVLIVLSKKAGKIAARALPSWLHQTTRYAAANANRAARRRRLHERRAARAEGQMDPSTDEINPLLSQLDDAIARLGETDRRAIVGRFLLGQDAAAVAASLGVSTRAAQKRIERAVERLRERLIAAQRSVGQGSAAAESSPRGAATASASPAAFKALAITPAVVAAVLTAAAPSPASAAVVAVPTVAATGLAKQTATWMTIAKVKIAAVAITTTAVAAGAVGTVGIVVMKFNAGPATAPTPVVQVASVPAAAPAAAPGPIVTRGTLSNGISLELIGSANNPSNGGEPWYTPDGSRLATPPYKSPNTIFGKLPGEVAREFAFKYDPAAVSLSTQSNSNLATLRVDPARSRPSYPYVGLLTASGQDGTIKPGVICVLRKGPIGTPQSPVFSIAAGPWVPRIVSLGGEEVRKIDDGDVIHALLTPPFEEAGEACIGYWWAEFHSDPDRRLVAIDVDGQIHFPQQQAWDFRPAAQRAAEPVLDMPLPAMRLTNMTFGELIETLRNDTGVQFDVDWEGFKREQGIDAQTRISGGGAAQSQPLYKWLANAFQFVQSDHGGEPQFDVKDGVVRIFPRNPAKPNLVYYHVPGLPLSRLARFEVQTRPFDQWIAFDGLSMDLGKPMPVSVRTSDTESPAAGADGGATASVEGGLSTTLVALFDPQTQQCWRPDGSPGTLPFGVDDYGLPTAEPGRRYVWLFTTTRLPDGRYGSGRGRVMDPATGQPVRGVHQSGVRDINGVRYQLYALEVGANQKTFAWRTDLASRPTARVSLQRGETGWNPMAIAKLSLGSAGEAILWGPANQSLFGDPGPNLSMHLWAPPTLGEEYDLDMDYTQDDGNRPAGWSMSPEDGGGNRRVGCNARMQDVYRATLVATHYDRVAAFWEISLQPGVRTTVEVGPGPARGKANR